MKQSAKTTSGAEPLSYLAHISQSPTARRHTIAKVGSPDQHTDDRRRPARRQTPQTPRYAAPPPLRPPNVSLAERPLPLTSNFCSEMAPPKSQKPGRSALADVVTREYTIHLHKRVFGVSFKKRAPKAIKEIKDFARKSMVGTPLLQCCVGEGGVLAILEWRGGVGLELEAKELCRRTDS